MKTYTQKLEDYLECDGWDIQAKYLKELDSWADEIWELSSNWSPERASAYITFLVDPDHEGERTKGQSVWGLGCSKTYPINRIQAESGGAIGFGKGFKNHMPEFQLTLESLRTDG